MPFKLCSKIIVFKWYDFRRIHLMFPTERVMNGVAWKEYTMIEIGKKYRWKKLKGWFEKDSEEFTVLCFGEHNIVGCVAPDGEKYVFDKDFLIDPDKPDEIYADIKIMKG